MAIIIIICRLCHYHCRVVVKVVIVAVVSPVIVGEVAMMVVGDIFSLQFVFYHFLRLLSSYLHLNLSISSSFLYTDL